MNLEDYPLEQRIQEAAKILEEQKRRKVDYKILWNRLYESIDANRDHRDYLDTIATKMERMVAEELRHIENAKTWDSLKEIK